MNFFDNEIINFSSLIPLSETEQKKLLIKAKNGDIKAKEEFIKSYLIIIKGIIDVCSFGINGLNDNIFSQLYDDIFQEGILAVMKAYEKFDFNRTTQFRFYFGKSIYRAIHRYLIRNSKSYSVPIEVLENFNSIYGFIAQMTLKNEEYPSTSEISLKMNISREVVEHAINNTYPLVNFDDIEDCFVDKEKNNEEFLTIEDNLSATKIVTEALLEKYLEIYTQEELKNIYDFARIYQLNEKNKASENELLELKKIKEKMLLLDNSLIDEKSIYDKNKQVYFSLRRVDIIIKRVLLSPNDQWLQGELGEYYGVDRRMISQIENSSLKKIKKYLKK